MRKSHGPVAVRGRISLPLSFDDFNYYSQPTEPRRESADSVRNRRAWSDVGPHTHHCSTSPLSREPSVASIPHDKSHGMHSYNTPCNAEITQNLKRPVLFPSTIHSRPPVPRSWTVRMPTAIDGSHLPERVAAPFNPPTSPARFPISRFTRYVPRMSLFREVMRDEVY